MNMTPDNELLRQYANNRSEDAFAELVRRHVDLVYSAAFRQVGGDAHHAQDVAQAVFTDLARKAAALSRRESLTGWLYTSAHFAATKITRTESRRRNREEQFMREPSNDTSPEADWEKLRPALDSAMYELKEGDREAVLLRYFENRPFAEVGAKLCLTEIAARKRVERAVEKLRALLAKRGITTTTALASVISANAVQVAPASLAGSLATSALSHAGAGAFPFFQTMNIAKLKFGLGALATAGVVGALVVQLHAQRTLQAQNETLSEQIAQLKADNEQLSNQISVNADSLTLQKDQSDELLKLRAEVTQLRSINRAPALATAPTATNSPAAIKTAINLKIKFVSLLTANAQAVGGGLLSASGDTSILSEQQLEVVNNGLRGAASLTTESEITTSNGQEAFIGAQQPVYANGTNANAPVTLDVLPCFLPGASMFTLNVAAKLNQLTGVPSQPGAQVIEASNHVTLFPGQTVALKVEIPQDGWLPRTRDNAVAQTAPDGPTELLVFVTPKLVDSTDGIQAASPSDTGRAQVMETMSEAKQGVLALLMFANDNEKQYPTNLEQAATYMRGDYMAAVESNFDFINPGSITNVAQPATTILLKEKQAVQMPDGRWGKTYGFADGHSEFHSEPNGDFTEFENQHTISAMVNP